MTHALIGHMTDAEFETTFPDEASCNRYLAARRWLDGAICPRCSSSRTYRLKTMDRKWECPDCSKSGYRFSILTGTIFENTKAELRLWFLVIHAVITGPADLSAREIQRRLGAKSYKTIWAMRQRIIAARDDADFKRLIGETDLQTVQHFESRQEGDAVGESELSTPVPRRRGAVDETRIPFCGKVSPPKLSRDNLTRERLLRDIADKSSRILAVLAPVGYGKSTLLTQLFALTAAKKKRAAWLTIDSHDNDLSHFLLHLQAICLQLGCPTVPLPALVPPSIHVREAMDQQLAHARLTLEAIIAFPHPFLIVLDDFERISDPAVLALVQTLGDHLRDGQQLAIGSRTTPLLTLASWRCQGRLHQISATALRFELDETSAFLRDQTSCSLDPEECHLLHSRTDGWPAAIRLATIALGGVDNPTRWILTLSGSNETISDYLVENMLAQLPESRRDFLLGSSVMEIFNASACEQVLGRTDCQAELDAIGKSNLFLVSLDAEGNWYRYHSMFREFLQRQLDRRSPNLLAKLKHRAALWFAGQKLFTEAMSLALESGDVDLAAEILNDCALDFVGAALLSTLETWFDALPPKVYRNRHRLMRARAYTLIATHRYAEALEALEELRRVNRDARDWEIDVQIALLYSWMDRQNEVVAMCDSLKARFGFGSEEDTKLSSAIFCNIMIYTHCFNHDLASARSWLPAAKKYVKQVPGNWSSSYTLCFEAMLDLIEGQLPDALQRLEQAAGSGAAGGLAAAISFRSVALYEVNKLDEAELILEPILDEIRRSGAPDPLTFALRTAARIAYFKDPDGSRHIALLNDLIDLSETRQIPRLMGAALLEKATMALMDGDQEAAGKYHLQASAPELWEQTRGFRLFAQEIQDVFIVGAQIAVSSGEGASILTELEAATQQALVQGRRWRRLRLQTLLAQAQSQAGSRGKAIATLSEALQGLRPGGYVRVIADCPWALHDLLAELSATTKRVNPDVVGAIVSAANKLDPHIRLKPGSFAWDKLLTARERAVLDLAAKGKSNKTIAFEMGISDNTVETHLRNINVKLGTHNRIEAIQLLSRP